MSVLRKIVASSYERYNGGAAVKRAYGSATVTRFYVYQAGDPASEWMQLEGKGKTPGDRKTAAVNQYLKAKGLAEPAPPSRPLAFESKPYQAPPLPHGMTEEQREALYHNARQAGGLGDSMIKSFSGADQADSEKYFGERRVYIDVAAGIPFEEAFAKEDARWRSYAKKQAEKVAAAPKIKSGPSAGHSAISHRWVDPEAFQSRASHVRFMVQAALGEHRPSLPPGTSKG